jgi:DNA-binding MarR family transcriptional regulator
VLQQERFVAYNANPDHQRAKLVCLTEKGQRTVKELTRHQATWANHIASAVGAADIQAALTVVKKLRSRLGAN